MGKVVDTTYVEDTTYLLSQTPKNFVKDDYWLREMQEKVWADWNYIPNRVDIEEEKGFGTEEYEPLEVIIQTINAHSGTNEGTKVRDDWRRVVFKDIFSHREVGTRYRFSYKFDLNEPNENKSVWIAVNQNSATVTAAQDIVRCNGTLGSIWVDENGNRVYHYEPVVQGTSLSSTVPVYSDVAIDPKSQLVIICQHNKYTRDYYINQRFVIGYDRVYKIKNIIKTGSLTTYDPYDVGVIEIYLDMDQIGEKDDFVNRIAYNGRDDETLVPTPIPPVADYQLKIETAASYPYVLGGDPLNFKVNLYNGETVVENAVYIDISSTISTYKNYYEVSGVENVGEALMISDNSIGFTLTRTKTSNRITLSIKCFIPAEASPAGEELSQTIEVKIGNV